METPVLFIFLLAVAGMCSSRPSSLDTKSVRELQLLERLLEDLEKEEHERMVYTESQDGKDGTNLIIQLSRFTQEQGRFNLAYRVSDGQDTCENSKNQSQLDSEWQLASPTFKKWNQWDWTRSDGKDFEGVVQLTGLTPNTDYQVRRLYVNDANDPTPEFEDIEFGNCKTFNTGELQGTDLTGVSETEGETGGEMGGDGGDGGDNSNGGDNGNGGDAGEGTEGTEPAQEVQNEIEVLQAALDDTIRFFEQQSVLFDERAELLKKLLDDLNKQKEKQSEEKRGQKLESMLRELLKSM